MSADNYIKSLQKKPDVAKHEDYHWADYIELLCIANLNGELSEADVFDRFAEREEDLKEGHYDDVSEMDVLDQEGLGEPTQRYRKSEYWIDRIRSWYEIIESRRSRYGHDYPFEIVEDDLIFDFNNENVNHKYYIYLLFCSKLYLFSKQESQKLSSYYELLSLDGLKRYLPLTFTVFLFGTSDRNTDSRYGKGVTCLNKIKTLAEDLHEKLDQDFNEDAYPPTNRGDEGLDIVAYSDTRDDQGSKIVIFGQCACTKNWVTKQSSSSFNAWSNKIAFTAMPLNAVFIPFCYRNRNGAWYDRGKIMKTFVIDRFRLIRFLNEKHVLSDEINEFIETIIAAKEPPF